MGRIQDIYLELEGVYSEITLMYRELVNDPRSITASIRLVASTNQAERLRGELRTLRTITRDKLEKEYEEGLEVIQNLAAEIKARPGSSTLKGKMRDAISRRDQVKGELDKLDWDKAQLPPDSQSQENPTREPTHPGNETQPVPPVGFGRNQPSSAHDGSSSVALPEDKKGVEEGGEKNDGDRGNRKNIQIQGNVNKSGEGGITIQPHPLQSSRSSLDPDENRVGEMDVDPNEVDIVMDTPPVDLVGGGGGGEEVRSGQGAQAEPLTRPASSIVQHGSSCAAFPEDTIGATKKDACRSRSADSSRRKSTSRDKSVPRPTTAPETHTCPQCSRPFSTRYNLDRHIQEEHERVKFSCPICGREFSRKERLKAHLRNVHGEDLDDGGSAKKRKKDDDDDDDEDFKESRKRSTRSKGIPQVSACPIYQTGYLTPTTTPGSGQAPRDGPSDLDSDDEEGTPAGERDNTFTLSDVDASSSSYEDLDDLSGDDMTGIQVVGGIIQDTRLLRSTSRPNQGTHRDPHPSSTGQAILDGPSASKKGKGRSENMEAVETNDSSNDSSDGDEDEDPSGPPDDSCRAVLSTVVPDGNGRWPCPLCGRTFKHKHHLGRHLRTDHNDASPFLCPTCGASFRRKDVLDSHQITHKDARPFVCEECGAPFKTKAHLEQHKLIHYEERPFVCPECGLTFKRKGFLDRHKLIHDEERPFVCPECGATFKNRRYLEHHKISHSEERHFVCSECGAPFKTKSHLEQHKMTHINARPHSCPYCSEKFSRRNNMIGHVEIVHPFNRPLHPCHICSSSNFTSLDELYTHIQDEHTTSDTIKCAECILEFNTVQNVISHHRTSHLPEQCDIGGPQQDSDPRSQDPTVQNYAAYLDRRKKRAMERMNNRGFRNYTIILPPIELMKEHPGVVNKEWLRRLEEGGKRIIMPVYIGKATNAPKNLLCSGYHVDEILHQISTVGQLRASQSHDAYVIHSSTCETEQDMMEMESIMQEYIRLRYETFEGVPSFTGLLFKPTWVHAATRSLVTHPTKTSDELSRIHTAQHAIARSVTRPFLCFSRQCEEIMEEEENEGVDRESDLHKKEGAVFSALIHPMKQFIKLSDPKPNPTTPTTVPEGEEDIGERFK